MSKQKPRQIHTPSPPNTGIFLTNLRLLNLDRCNDWPSISTDVLTSKDAGPNQKARVAFVEWALFRLFKIWDAEEAEIVNFYSTD